jgi:hypothetical protein
LDNLPALRVAGVQWVRRSADTQRIDGLIPHDQHWLRVPETLPRARMITRVHQSDHPANQLQRIDVAEAAVVQEPLAIDRFEPGRVEVVTDRPGRLQLAVACRGRQLLVVSERYHPGWHAVVDGQPQPVLRVNGDFLGCLVGEEIGEIDHGRNAAVEPHRVELRFMPRSLWLGRLVSLLGIGLTAVCYVGYGWRRRRRLLEDDLP